MNTWSIFLPNPKKEYTTSAGTNTNTAGVLVNIVISCLVILSIAVCTLTIKNMIQYFMHVVSLVPSNNVYM